MVRTSFLMNNLNGMRMGLGGKVSVVIPAYNAEEFIVDAARSCFAQTYRPLEVIVVNDGSTDSTERVVKHLSSSVSSGQVALRLVNVGENKGAGNALNVGFSSAEGDYVCWLSADDMFIDSEKLRKQVAYIEKSKALWSYFRSFYAGATLSNAVLTRPSYLPHLSISDTLFVRNPDLRLMLLLFRNPVNGSSVMITKDCVQTYGQFEPTRNADHDGDLWMRYSALKLKLTAIMGAAVFYRKHPGQVSAKRNLMIYESDLTRMRMLLALEKKGNLTMLIKKFIPYFMVILLSREHLKRPFVSEFLFNYILSHKDSFDRIFLKYVRRSLNDLTRHSNYLMLDKEKFRVDLSSFKESHTFKRFEEIFLR
jgi:glycosyltransferase involved in cell wall biosynthesis